MDFEALPNPLLAMKRMRIEAVKMLLEARAANDSEAAMHAQKAVADIDRTLRQYGITTATD
ncbi:hypothetical protein [Sphingobium sp. DN12]|uniref:hypothetical protein n=1 Tax=Sphingobium sp. DN12 TaxID=3378073 RepID=UPI003DA42F75